MKYKVKVWIVVEEESEIDAAAFVERVLQDDVLVGGKVVEVDVDWDSAEEVEGE